ncbi:hypothetical protein DV738_g4235, partial [Chaetothyriales sp. CBS 135597]
MSVSNDGPESVDDFLARVASLSRKNDEEIAERNRKMEEEMMQARRQRRARREAASIKPPVVLAPPVQNQTESLTESQNKNYTLSRRESSHGPLPSAALPSPPFESPYRKSNEDSGIAQTPSSRGTQLPGMASNPSKADTPRQSPTYSLSPSPAPPSPKTQGYASASGNNTPVSTAIASSPEPEISARTAAASLNRTSSILSSPGRPPSPTKGLGGFVQSAMMKRSDSVNKRWSVQASGLKRGDSVAGGRPTFNPHVATPSLGQPRVITRDPKPSTDGASSPLTGSRPSSAHAVDVLADAVKEPVAERPAAEQPAAEKAVGSVSSEQQARPVTPSSESLLSRSPSKTMDPRRWSPTKASWLESALAKPESPRPAPAKVEPPAWKVGLERSRSQRRPDASPTRSSNFDSVTTGGLLRHPAPGSSAKPQASPPKPLSLTDQPKAVAEIQASQPPENAPTEQLTTTSHASVELTVDPKPSSLPSHPDRSEEQTRDSREGGTEMVTRPTTATHDLPLAARSPVDSSRDSKSPALKPKPQTPPKLDFRSTLRSRQTDSTASKDGELEFKAVFGKLKRTQTQNYVAPDLFKQNITQGKAALHVTGGPQKTKRVDELKESLLSRKAEMKAGGGTIHKRADIRGVKESSQDKEPEVPEALARRRTLHKTNASTSSTSPEPRVERQKPTAPDPSGLTVPKTESSAIKPAAPTPVQNTFKTPTPLPFEGTKPPSLGREGQKEAPAPPVNKFAPSDAPVRKLGEKTASQPQSDPVPPAGDSFPNLELTKTAGNKLAARLNPALAGLIARGSSPRSANGVQSPDVSSPAVPPRQPEEAEGSSGLTHMTKGRAKGPKRRAPKGEPTAAKLPEKITRIETPEPPSTDSGPVVVKPEAGSAAKPLANPTESRREKPAVSTRVPSSQKPNVTSPKPAAITLAAAPSFGAESKVGGVREKPRVASKSSELRRVSEQARLAINQSHGQSKENPPPQAGDISKGVAQELAPSNPARPIAALVRSPEKAMPLTPSKSRLNSPKLPDSVASQPVVKAPPKTVSGNGISADPKPLATKSGLTAATERAERVGDRVGRASDIEKVLVDSFGSVPRMTERREFDSEAFLKGHSSKGQRIKTISNKMMKVAGDGKQTAMPPSQEHILYEDSMYLCVHQFESTGSTSVTEVCLWVGDSVPEAAVEDAQIFCRKVARDNEVKLQVIKQGMEPASFLSGLGGILIVRTNTSSDSYMLCGRRHGGHLVFDQVEFSPASLCSGFSYLISAKLGKLYLWIGAGSCADEYGAARLVGADLGLAGEMEEVSEGREPADFWKAFPSTSAKQQYQRSDTWAMRSGHEHNGFPCKLYRIEQDRPKSSGGFWGLRASSPPKSVSKVSLQEIDPFSQRDLSSDYVHLLDAYAVLYVLPGKPSRLKSADFVSALHIAQELAVLIPSVQDRALLPSCRVAFGEPPRDCQVAFRKWSWAKGSGAGERGSACFDIADVMDVLS